MEDIFYCSERLCLPSNIKALASKVGLETKFSTSDSISVYLDDEEFWDFYKFANGNYQGLEDDDLQLIQKYPDHSFWCISHHAATLQELLQFMQILLEEYGGWIAPDSSFEDHHYYLKDISDFSYGY